MKTLPPPSAQPFPRQHGAALLTALIFLVVLTLLGVGMFTTSTSEEGMARNFRDKEIALQAAEAAMNEAKVVISGSYDTTAAPGTLPKAYSADLCTKGGTTPTGYSCYDSINVASLDLFSGAITGAPVGQAGTTISPQIVGLYNSTQPRYLIVPFVDRADKCDRSRSDLKSRSGAPYCFQIIAQGRGRLSNTRVTLVELFTN